MRRERLVIPPRRLALLREEAGLTQEQAAVAAGLTSARLRQLEQEGGSLRTETLGRLALLYRVGPQDLLTWEQHGAVTPFKRDEIAVTELEADEIEDEPSWSGESALEDELFEALESDWESELLPPPDEESREADLVLADAGPTVDDDRVAAAEGDLRSDAFRSGRPATRAEFNRTVTRHRLTIAEAALLELRAEDAELLDSSSDEVTELWDLRVRERTSARSIDSLRRWLDEIGSYPLLVPHDEVILARAIELGVAAEDELDVADDLEPAVRAKLERAEARGRQARQLFITSNLRLVVSIAKRYRGQGLDFLDLISEGVLGLMRAVEKFDWRKGFKFSTYTTWWIRQSVERALANQSRAIRIPVHVVEKIRRIDREERALTLRLGREPTLPELADHLQMSPAEIAALKDLDNDLIALDRTVSDDPNSVTVGELLMAPDLPVEEQAAQDELVESLHRVLRVLPLRERRVLELRFGLDESSEPLTLEEIGRIFGLTRERIRQIETQSLERLRDAAAKEGLTPE